MMARLATKPGTPMSVKTMAEADDVPYQFARAIQRDLADAELIKVIRGSRGGAILSRPAKDITLYEIVVSTQGKPQCSPCTRDVNWCSRQPTCPVHPVWNSLDVITEKFLKEVTLSEFS